MQEKLENFYGIVKNLTYKYGKYGKKKHGCYLHIFSKDRKKCLKFDTYNGHFEFGVIEEKIEKKYNKFEKRFFYGNNEFTGVRITTRFWFAQPKELYSEEKQKNYLKEITSAYKFIIQNT